MSTDEPLDVNVVVGGKIVMSGWTGGWVDRWNKVCWRVEYLDGVYYRRRQLCVHKSKIKIKHMPILLRLCKFYDSQKQYVQQQCVHE